jgi:phosphate/sulfate permease
MFSIVLIPLLIGMFLSMNMGASGIAPSFSTAYGSNAIRKDLIPGLFGIFVFIGAIVAGKKVMVTLGEGILPSTIINIGLTSVLLLSIALTMFVSNLLSIPQSTSQTTVFALTGAGLYYNIFPQSKLVTQIIPAWLILPWVAFILTFIIGKWIYPHFESFSNKQQKGWKLIIILTSCYVAFSIGSNNVANASAPLSYMIFNEYLTNSQEAASIVMILMTLMIAPCFGIGSSILGHNILETTGKNITDLGNMGAIIISCITASLLLFASLSKGIPTSLVQMNVASIIAWGICRNGWKKTLSSRSVKKMILVWVLAPFLACFLAYICTWCADMLHLL